MNLAHKEMIQGKQILDYFEVNFGIDFISNSIASYLVIDKVYEKESKSDRRSRVKINKVQIEMLRHNNGKIMGVIPMVSEELNGNNKLYYNITSHIQLNQYLKRKIFSRKEFINLLLHITHTLSECKKFILSENSFVIDTRYMYILPGTIEIGFLYLPIHSSVDINIKFKAFLSNIIMEGIHFKTETTDDFLQKIIAFCKLDTFSIKSFEQLLRTLIKEEIEQKIFTFKREENKKEVDLYTSIASEGAKQEEAVNSSLKKICMGNSRREISINNQQNAKSSVVSKLRSFIGGIGKPFEDMEIPLHELREEKTLDKEKANKIKFLSIKNINKSKLQNRKYEDLAEEIIDAGVLGEEIMNDEKRINVNRTLSAECNDSDTCNIKEKYISSNRTTLLKEQMKEVNPFIDVYDDGSTKRVEIDKESFIIGRYVENVDYAINNPAVGRMHLEIIKSEGGFYIKDLNSKNGTYINNKRLENSKVYKLNNDDCIMLANVQITFIHN